jgi:hypothetical protein
MSSALKIVCIVGVTAIAVDIAGRLPAIGSPVQTFGQSAARLSRSNAVMPSTQPLKMAAFVPDPIEPLKGPQEGSGSR